MIHTLRSQHYIVSCVNAWRKFDTNNIYFIEYNKSKKEFRREKKVAQYPYKYDMMKEIENEEIIDNSFLWYIFRTSMVQVDQKGIAPVRNEQGKLITDTEGIVNEWMLHNEKLLNILQNAVEYSEFYEYIDSTVDKIHRNWGKDSNVQNMLVTESEICKLINGLSAGKASGYDGIDTPMLVNAWYRDLNHQNVKSW